MKKQKLIIFLTVFIDVVGLGLVIPTLPLYVSKYGASPFLATTFFAVYALCQFFGAPFLGSLSDRIGRRPVLIFSLLGTSIGWFVFALANSLPLLFLARIIDGITGGNISTAQSYLVDIARSDRERTENLGILGAAFGMGFILGPALGGVLSGLGQTVPFWIAGILAMLNTIAAVFFLPETHHNRNQDKKISINPLLPILRGFRNKKVASYLWSWFLFSLGFTVMQTIFTLYTNSQFGFNETQAGYLLAMVGVIVALNQGFLLKRFWLKKFPEPLLEIAAIITLMIGFLGFASEEFAIFFVFLILFSFAQSIVRVVSNSQIVGNADPSQKGEIMGIVQGLTSLASIIMPPISGFAFERLISAPWYIAAVFMLIALLLILRQRRKFAKSPLPTDAPVLS